MLQELNAICVNEVPPPNNFVLVSKDKAIHKGNYLEYGYYSEAKYSGVKAFYRNNLAQRGWNLTDQNGDGSSDSKIEFRKGFYEITLYYWKVNDGVNYKLRCERLATAK